MSTTDLLIERIERYCAAKGMSPTTFGRHAVNDGKLLPRLKSGRSITLLTLARIDAFFARDEMAPPAAPPGGTVAPAGPAPLPAPADSSPALAGGGDTLSEAAE